MNMTIQTEQEVLVIYCGDPNHHNVCVSDYSGNPSLKYLWDVEFFFAE